MDIIGFNRDLFTYWVNKTLDKQQNSNDFITDVIYCGVLEKMKIEWMQLEDGTKCMPFIWGKDEQMYRVNNCPSVGTAHNAISDCYFQVGYCSAIWSSLHCH